MADDALRLRADVVDRATPALRRIRKELGEVRKTTGMDALGQQMQALQSHLEGFVKSGGGITGVFEAMGVGGLTAATSLVGLVAKFKELAQQTQVLKELGRETGLTVDQLNQLQHVGPRFNVSADQMTKGLETFADKMVDVRRGWGDVVSELNGQGLGAFVKKLQKDSPADAVRDAFSLLGSDKMMANPALQKRWTEMLFGDGGLTQLFAQGAKGVQGEWDDLAKTLDPIKPATLKSAEDMARALQSLRTEISNLENLAEPHVFDVMATDLRDVAAAVKLVTDGLKYLETLTTNPGAALSPYYKDLENKDGVFAPPRSDADGADRLAKMRTERDALAATLDSDKAKNPLGFATRDASGISRLGELNLGIQQMLDALKQSPAAGDADGRRHYRKMRLDGFGAGVDGLRRNVAFTGATGFGVGDGTPFEQAVERGVFKGLVDYANRGDLEGGGARGAGGGIVNAAFHPGGGLSLVGGSDQTPIGRAVAALRGASGGGSAALAGLGGSRSWRNNNPGNLEFGQFARSMGATGTDGRFAIFPDYQTGRSAQEKLLFDSKNYRNLTLAQAIGRWAPGSENNVPAYIAAMHADPNTLMSAFSPSQRGALLDAMQKHEGWRVGQRSGASPRVGSLKLPPGGYWAKDSTGKPVAVGPDGQSLGPDGRPARLHSASLLDLARDAGVTHHKHELTGGAHVRIQLAGGEGTVRGVSTKTSGMVRSIDLDRGTSMMPTVG